MYSTLCLPDDNAHWPVCGPVEGRGDGEGGRFEAAFGEAEAARRTDAVVGAAAAVAVATGGEGEDAVAAVLVADDIGVFLSSLRAALAGRTWWRTGEE